MCQFAATLGRPQDVAVALMNAPLSFVHDIERTIANSSGARRAEMARRLTDIYLVNSDKYSDAEIAVFDDVFVRLVVTIEESSRALLAIRLGPMSKTPPKILRALACDDAIDVASTVLTQSDNLDDLTVILCAKTKSQEHLLAISRRRSLGEAVTDVLVERGDQQVVLSTAQNAGARFSNSGFTNLVMRSNGDDRLAICVGARRDIPPQMLKQLIDMASESVRSKLAAENPRAKAEIDRVVTEVAKRIEAKAAVQAHKCATAPMLLNELEQLDATRLDAYITAGRLEETVTVLAVMSGIPAHVVASRLKDEFVDFLVILAKTLNLSRSTTKAILTLGARKNRCAINAIEQGLVELESMNRETALQIVAVYRRG